MVFSLSTEEVPEADDCVLRVFHQLMFCAGADILCPASFMRSRYSRDSEIRTVSSPWKEIAEAIWRSPSSLAIQSASPSCNLSERSLDSELRTQTDLGHDCDRCVGIPVVDANDRR